MPGDGWPLGYGATFYGLTVGGAPLAGSPAGGVTVAGPASTLLAGGGQAPSLVQDWLGTGVGIAPLASTGVPGAPDDAVVVGSDADMGGAAISTYSSSSALANYDSAALALNADVAINDYGVTGSGIKIGVLSDSFNVQGGAPAAKAAGDLGSYTILREGPAGSTDEGQAMAEVIHAAAPNAQVYFYTADDGEASFAAGIQALANAGCQIIVDDVTYYDESFFQEGDVISAAVNAVVAQGVSYFTAASNEQNNYYQSAFTGMRTVLPGVSGVVTAQNFGGGNPYTALYLGPDSSMTIDLQWDQPFASIGVGHSSQSSLSMFLYNQYDQLVASATSNDVGGNPVQLLDFTNYASTGNYYYLAIVDAAGAAPGTMKFIVYGDDAYLYAGGGAGSGDVIGHEMDPNANTVGAVYWGDTPRFGVSPATAEYFSSSGPGEYLFDANGNRLSTPDMLNKVNFSAPDGSATSVFDPFFGTSAAAPDAAAVAALMLQARPTLTPADVTALLADTTVPEEETYLTTAGLVNGTNPAQTGTGLIQANQAVAAAETLDIPVTASSPTVLNGIHLNDTFTYIAGAHEINGGSGANTLDLSSLSASQSVAFAGSFIAGGPAGSGYFDGGQVEFTNIQAIKDTAYNDTIYAGSGSESIYAGAGNDSIYAGNSGSLYVNGGTGAATVDYAGNSSRVSVNLATDVVTRGAVTDTLVGVDRVITSGLNDSLVGGVGDDTFVLGNGGNDTINGGAGATTVDFSGLLPADYFIPGVSVNLATGSATYSDSFYDIPTTTDLLISVKDVIGSSLSDTLIGAGAGDVLNGGSGGNDSLVAGTGNETLIASASGNDTLVGGPGSETYSYTAGDGQGVIHNGVSTGTTPTGVLELGGDLNPGDLWFTQSGNNLVIQQLASTTEVTLVGWFAHAYAQLQSVTLSNGSISTVVIDALAQVMTAAQAANPSFNPSATVITPSDPTVYLELLQGFDLASPAQLQALTDLSIPGGATEIGVGTNVLADGGPDAFLRLLNGQVQITEFNVAGTSAVATQSLTYASGAMAAFGSATTILGTATDFVGTGGRDVFFRADNGQVEVWEVNGSGVVVGGYALTYAWGGMAAFDGATAVVGTGTNFVGMGGHDVFFRTGSGQFEVWEINGSGVVIGGQALTYTVGVPAAFDGSTTVVGTGTNFVGMGGHDVFFRTDSGQVEVSEVSGSGAVVGTQALTYASSAIATFDGATTVIGTGMNFVGMGGHDVFFRAGSGQVELWEVSGSGAVIGGQALTYAWGGMATFDGATTVVGTGTNFVGMGGHDVFFRAASGQLEVWEVNGSGAVFAGRALLNDAGQPFTIDNATTVIATGTDSTNGEHDLTLQYLGGAIQTIDVNGGSLAVSASTASYASATAGVTANLATGAVSINGVASESIEAQTLIGSNHDDLLTAGVGDSILGGSGNNTIVSGAGSDTLDGGAGTNTVSFANATAGVSVNLATGSVSGGYGQGDVLTNFQTVIGSAYSDTLVGGAGDVLNGGAGSNDSLVAGAGNETLIASTGGNDTFMFGSGSGQDVIQNTTGNSVPNGQLDIGVGVATNQLWLMQSGNNLQIDIMGTTSQITVSDWYASAANQLREIVTADGSMLDSQLNNLVSAMATFSADHPGFNPTATANSQAPNDPNLQAVLASAWHH